MIGKVFGEWSVVHKSENKDSCGTLRYICKCSCGVTKEVSGVDLRANKSTNCGCKRGTHQQSHANRTPTYVSWSSMKQRVKDVEKEKYYGDVEVCKEWASFLTFFGDMGERPKGKTLDRINPFGNYEASNCRWATPLEQRHNWRKHAM